MDAKQPFLEIVTEAQREAGPAVRDRRTRKRSPKQDPWVSSLRAVLGRDGAAELARNFGASPGEIAGDPFAALARVLRDETAVRAVLTRLGGPALVALTLLLSVVNRAVDLELLRTEVDRRLGAKGWGLVAQDALEAAGLLLSPGGGMGPAVRPSAVLPTVLGDALEPQLIGLADLLVDATGVVVERGAETAWSDVPLALLLGAFLRNPPRVTQEGYVFVAAVDKLAQMFWPAAGDARARVERLIRVARDLGLLVLRGGYGRVQPGAIRAWAALPPAERRLRRLALERGAGDAGMHAAFDRLLRAAGDGWVRSDELLSRAALALGAFGPQDYSWRRMTANDVARPAAASLAALAGLELIERAKLADGTEVLRLAPAFRPAASAPTPSGGRVYAQPNFEVIVPPDAEVEIAFGLARVAELRRVEDAATLVVTAASVAQARETGWTRTEILGALERAAPGALPQNVVATVAGWAGAALPARFIEGVVFHCPDPEAAERMRRSPDGAALFERELAPGVWILRAGRQGKVAQAARAAGVDFMPQVERPERDDPWAREESSGPTDAQLAGLRAISVPAAPPAELAQAVAMIRASRPPAVIRQVPQDRPAKGRAAASPAPAKKPSPSFTERIASLFRGRAPLIDVDDEEPEVDLERLEWHPAPPRDALLEALGACEEEGIELAIGYRNARGDAVRRVVVVERLQPKRGRLFVEAFAYREEESISLPVESIDEIAVVGPGDRPLLAPFLDPAPRVPVRVGLQVGRNDPCPCGSGRKFKRCCGR